MYEGIRKPRGGKMVINSAICGAGEMSRLAVAVRGACVRGLMALSLP